MINRRRVFSIGVAVFLLPMVALGQVGPATLDTASIRLNRPDPENDQIGVRAGSWDVVETVWDATGAGPAITTGQVAERRVIGPILQEFLHSGSDTGDMERIDYLSFNRVDDRWRYVSMDVRAPVGIMPAVSFDRGEPGVIDLQFDPFALAGAGAAIRGQMLRMTQVITSIDADHDRKDQFFLLADGTATKWLAHRYDYRRR